MSHASGLKRKNCMLKKIVWPVLILLHFFAHSQWTSSVVTQNSVQIDGFLFDQQMISSNKQNYTGSSNQIFTARPAASFYFYFDSYTIRPRIVLNPFNSSTEGSLALGRLFFDDVELGLWTTLNRDQKSLGTQGMQNATIENDFLIGPYVDFYFGKQEDWFFECLLNVSYVYENQQAIVFGATDLIKDERGARLLSNLFFHYRLKDNLAWSPNMVASYGITSDLGGASAMRNRFDVQVMPLSFRVFF